VAAALPATAGAAGGVSNIWTAPDPATADQWEDLGRIDCFAPAPTPGVAQVRLMSVSIIGITIGQQLKFTGEVRDTNGNLLANKPVAILVGRFRPTDVAALMKKPLQSNSVGKLEFAIPTRELRRNTLLWPVLPGEVSTLGACASKDGALKTTALNGVADPLMVSVRPLLKVDRSFTAKGKKVTVKARLVAEDVSRAGKVQLYRRAGSKWKKVGQPKSVKRNGLVTFGVSVSKGKTSYQLVFTPRKNSPDYTATAERRFSITYNPPTPRRPKGGAVVSQGVVVNRPEPKRKTLDLPGSLLG
jgi:hypothetical protein